MRRYGMRDDQWERIRDLLPEQEGHMGVTAADNRLFVEAVLYRYRALCRGAIFRSASATGRTCISASADGPSRVSGRRSSSISLLMPTMNMRGE